MRPEGCRVRAPSPCFHQPTAMPRAAGAVTHRTTTTSARALPSASRDRPRCRHTAAGACGVQPAQRSRDLVHDGADQHRKGYLLHGLACHGRHHCAGHRHSPCMALIDVVTSGVRGSLRQTSNTDGWDRQGNESGGKTLQTLELCFCSEAQPDTGPARLCVTTLARRAKAQLFAVYGRDQSRWCASRARVQRLRVLRGMHEGPATEVPDRRFVVPRSCPDRGH